MTLLLELDVPRLLGALSGLSLAVSISPHRPTIRSVLAVKLSVYLAFSLAPLTFYLMTSNEKFVFHAAGVFIASLINSVVILPVILHLTTPRGTK